MAQERILQHDMFNGELVDTRTRAQKKADRERAQPKQTLMFSQRDIAQVGVNPHPTFPLSPLTKAGPLFEDTRTPEEIERDRQREAEAHTARLFEDLPEPPTGAKTVSEPADKPQPAGEAQPVPNSETRANPKEAAYLAVARIAKEQVATIWVAEQHRRSFDSQLPLAILDAQAAGLTPSEIAAAMQIGQRDGSRLRKQNTAMSASYATPLDESKRGPIPIYAANNSPTRGAPVAGFRARWRQTTARVRSRRYNLPSQPSASSSLALGRPA